MDHILKPSNAIHDHIEVPYLADLYDGGPFATFLERRCLDRDLLLRMWQDGSMDEFLLGLLQQWLFFGVLTEVLFLTPTISAFKRRNDDGRDVVYTRELPRICNEFKAQVPYLLREDDRSRVEKVINTAQTMVDAICFRHSWNRDRQVIILSIVLLYNLIRDFWDLEFSSSLKGYLGFLESRMIDDGWCKSDVERLRYALEPEKLYFVAQMDPPTPLEDHRGCQKHRCLLKQLDWLTYETKHTYEGCACPHVTASQADMSIILESNAIPLVLWCSGSQMKIVSSDDYPNYVAISHVWSDRLGNTRANSLPRCQLERLHRIVNDLFEDEKIIVPFWIDTICCPKEPKESHDLAIISMRKTYRDAKEVLVLDAYLERTEWKPLSLMESLLRIICSSWTRRLWTFQEGVLAQSLLFQFADGALDFDATAARFGYHATKLTGAKINRTCALLRGKVDTVMIGAPLTLLRSVELLDMLSKALVFRATSVASDEALCLGTLTGTGMDTIVSALPPDRMRAFWSVQDGLSAAICLWNGPRLIGPPGYRWAPSGFLCNTDAGFGKISSAFNNVEARRTPSGLVFSSPCIFLHAWARLLDHKFYLRDDQRRWYTVDWYPLTAHQEADENASNARPDSESIDFAVVVQTPFDFDAPEPRQPPYDISEAFLVSIEDRQDDVIHARLLGTVMIALADHSCLDRHKFSTDVLGNILQAHEAQSVESDLIGIGVRICELDETYTSLRPVSQPEEISHQNERSHEDIPKETISPGVVPQDLFLAQVTPYAPLHEIAQREGDDQALTGEQSDAGQGDDEISTRQLNVQSSAEDLLRVEHKGVTKLAVFYGAGRTTSILSEGALVMFDGVTVSPSQTWVID